VIMSTARRMERHEVISPVLIDHERSDGPGQLLMTRQEVDGWLSRFAASLNANPKASLSRSSYDQSGRKKEKSLDQTNDLRWAKTVYLSQDLSHTALASRRLVGESELDSARASDPEDRSKCFRIVRVKYHGRISITTITCDPRPLESWEI
jgi:hypothetical protein